MGLLTIYQPFMEPPISINKYKSTILGTPMTFRNPKIPCKKKTPATCRRSPPHSAPSTAVFAVLGGSPSGVWDSLGRIYLICMIYALNMYIYINTYIYIYIHLYLYIHIHNRCWFHEDSTGDVLLWIESDWMMFVFNFANHINGVCSWWLLKVHPVWKIDPQG